MRYVVLISVILFGAASGGEAAPRDTPRALVEHFVELLGELRFYALGQYLTEDANVVTARWTRSGFVNRVETARAWLDELAGGLTPRPFREILTNVRVETERSELAVVKADFAIVRETGVEASGVDIFTLVREDGGWKIASIAFTSIPELPETRAADTLESRVEAALSALPAKSSLYAKNLPTGREVAVRADEPMNTLSVIKLPILVLAFRDAEASKLDLDRRRPIAADDLRRGSGLLQTFQPGLEPTYRDLVTQMIVTSDNTATDILIEKLGLARINALLEERGFEQTRLLTTTGDLFRNLWVMKDPAYARLTDAEVYARGFPDDEGARDRSFAFEGNPDQWLGRSTAREMSRLLDEIYTGALASRASSDAMIAILKRQLYNSRLPRFVRFEGVELAHKTGDWPPIAANDVGILFHDGGPSIVSVFVSQNQGPFDTVEETIGTIAREIVAGWSR